MYLLANFIVFLTKILSFEILGFELGYHLIILTTTIIIFKIISIISNSNRKRKDK